MGPVISISPGINSLSGGNLGQQHIPFLNHQHLHELEQLVLCVKVLPHLLPAFPQTVHHSGFVQALETTSLDLPVGPFLFRGILSWHPLGDQVQVSEPASSREVQPEWSVDWGLLFNNLSMTKLAVECRVFVLWKKGECII